MVLRQCMRTSWALSDSNHRSVSIPSCTDRSLSRATNTSSRISSDATLPSDHTPTLSRPPSALRLSTILTLSIGPLPAQPLHRHHPQRHPSRHRLHLHLPHQIRLHVSQVQIHSLSPPRFELLRVVHCFLGCRVCSCCIGLSSTMCILKKLVVQNENCPRRVRPLFRGEGEGLPDNARARQQRRRGLPCRDRSRSGSVGCGGRSLATCSPMCCRSCANRGTMRGRLGPIFASVHAAVRCARLPDRRNLRAIFAASPVIPISVSHFGNRSHFGLRLQHLTRVFRNGTERATAIFACSLRLSVSRR